MKNNSAVISEICKDFGIIILKPDGVKSNLMFECEKEIRSRNIRIVSKKMVRLERTHIVKYFYYIFEDYISYMCEAEICAYFLESNNKDLDVEIYKIKKKIRDNHATNGKHMRNYIHGCHCGTEFFLQRRLLFPEFEEYEYSSGVDMYCKIQVLDTTLIEKIKQVKEKSNLIGVCIDLPEKYKYSFWEIIKENKLTEYIYCSITKTIELKNETCEVIYYFSRKNEKFDEKSNKFIFLGKVQNIKFNTVNNSIECYNLTNIHYTERRIDNVIQQLQDKGIFIDGILIYSSEMSLQEAECRYEYANGKGFLFTGGSGTIDTLGLFSMSINKTKPLLTLLNED